MSDKMVETDITSNTSKKEKKDLDDLIVESVAISGLTAISSQPSMLSNLAFSNDVANANLSEQNAIANQQAMNELGVSVTAKTAADVSKLSPKAARSAVDVLSGNEEAQAILDLKAGLSAFKGGGTGGNSGKVKEPLTGKVFVNLPIELIFEGIDPKDVNVAPPRTVEE